MRRIRILITLLLLIPLCSSAQEGVRFEKYTIGNGIALKANDGSYRVALSGFVQTQSDTRWYEQGDDQDLYTRFRVRRARMRLSGTALDNKLFYRLTTDFAAAKGADDELNGMLLDAFVGYNVHPNWSISVGQSSVSTDSRELALSSSTMSFVDRSRMALAFSTIREVGVFIDGTVHVGRNQFLRPSISITDGDGSFTKGSRTGGPKYGARLNYLPFGKFHEMGEFRESDLARELLPRLSIGGALSYNTATSDRRGGRTTGGQMYFDADKQVLLPSYTKFVADFLFTYKGLSVVGEYVKSWAHVPSGITYRARTDGSLADTFEGGLDAYVKGRMIMGEAYNIQGSYVFPQLFMVGARYTYMVPDENSFLNNTLYYNRNNQYEVSLSKFMMRSHAVKAQLSYILIDPEPGSRTIFDNTIPGGKEMMVQALLQVSF